MPSVDEFPAIAQKQIAAQQARVSSIAEQSSKKKMGIFERLANVGMGRREETGTCRTCNGGQAPAQRLLHHLLLLLRLYRKSPLSKTINLPFRHSCGARRTADCLETLGLRSEIGGHTSADFAHSKAISRYLFQVSGPIGSSPHATIGSFTSDCLSQCAIICACCELCTCALSLLYHGQFAGWL